MLTGLGDRNQRFSHGTAEAQALGLKEAIFQQLPSIKQVQSRGVEVGYGKSSQIS
jgi:hypothetical protein